jgi:hypothetical protein
MLRPLATLLTALLVVAVAEWRLGAVFQRGATVVSHRKPNVIAAPKSARHLPTIPGGPSLWLIGNSHTYALPGLKQGEGLRDDPGDTLIDQVAAQVSEAEPATAGASYLRVANPNLSPVEMLVRASYLVHHGIKPQVMVVAVTWRNVARGSDLRYEVAQTLAEPSFSQSLLKNLNEMPGRSHPALTMALESETRKAVRAEAEEANRSDADRLDEKLTDAVSSKSALIGQSAAIRARVYRSVAYQIDAFAGARTSQHVDPPVEQDLEINKAAFSALFRLAQNANCKLLVYLAPERSDLPPIVDGAREPDFDRWLEAEVATAGGTVVDARDVVPIQCWGWEEDTPDRSHFTEPGHKLLAERLVAAGEKAGIFSALAPP